MNIDHTSFLDKLNAEIEKLGIDLSDAKLDHIAYQTSDRTEYNVFREKLLNIAQLLKEPMFEGRRVGVFEFKTPLKYKDQNINIVELIEPKKDRNPDSGLEHAEYILPTSLETFVAKYPNVDWDTSAMNRDQFPMLILNLGENMRVKFPRSSILSN